MSNVRDFGAVGNGQADDTAAVRHAIEQGDGVLWFPPGTYRLTRTILVELARVGPIGIEGSAGTAKIVMDGPGPAFHLAGTHQGTAGPETFQPEVWARERTPTVLNVEVEGRHPEASGFLLEGTMQATFEGVVLRELLHGIRCHRRARNLLVSHCHIYHNRGVGVFLDHVNLHQAIIASSHVSYCSQGGIKVQGSEVRNLQITGNDIEYNYDTEAAASADVWIDSSADGSSVREGTIASNTIQARSSPGGANVRLVGSGAQRNHKAGLFTISGNLIGSQEINVHLVACRGVVVTGNVIYSGHRRNLQVDGSRNVVVGPNSFDHNPDYDPNELCTGVRLADTENCTLTGCVIQDCQTGRHTVSGAAPIDRDGLLEIVRCRRVTLSGLQVLDGYPHGVHVADSSLVSLTGSTIVETRAEKMTRAAVRFTGGGHGNVVSGNTLGAGADGALALDPAAGVHAENNFELPR
jgi:polygalacturonase